MLLNRNIENEITRFISGDCSADERGVISGLIASDPHYKKVYHELNQAWTLTAAKSQGSGFDINAAWAKVDQLTSREPLKVVHRVPSTSHLGKKVISWSIRIAAVLLIGLAVFQFAVNRNPMKTLASGNTISAPVQLSDGSIIYLNSSSSLKYPEKFGGDSREVYFWGEAFFEIAHNPARPFIIETGETRVKVIGTSFNIKAYPNTDEIEVVVNSGKVLFYHVDKNENTLGQVILQKGDKGIFSRKTGKISRLLNDEPNYLSWKTGMLVFSKTTLDKVFDEVGQKYGVKFTLADKDLAQLKLTATFDNESLDAVLEVLQLVHNLQFVNNGSDYLVKKKAG